MGAQSTKFAAPWASGRVVGAIVMLAPAPADKHAGPFRATTAGGVLHGSLRVEPGRTGRTDRPVKGVGGFEGLIRRLQKQVNHATCEIKLVDKDLDDIQRCAFDYQDGGFEHRLWPSWQGARSQVGHDG